MKIGDKVLFHFIDSFGEPNRVREATVVEVYPATKSDPLSCDLDVLFLEEDFVVSSPATRQSRVVQATQDPPESGSWTLSS